MQQFGRCRGLNAAGVSRRAFLHTTVSAGTAGLTLPSLLRAQATASDSGRPASDTAVIQIWLGGGPTHFETYDPKPLAPAEYRGPMGTISTSLPGVEFCEVLPRHAQLMDRLAIIRSVFHNSSSHDNGMFYCVTGKRQKFEPSTGSYAARILGPRKVGVPAYVHLGFRQTTNLVFAPNFKAHYLGGGYDPFYITADPADKEFQVPNLQLADGVTIDRLDDRKFLLSRFDRIRRRRDKGGAMATMDQFNSAAFDMVTGPRARKAFDLTNEDARTRERYGMHRWGQSCLLARRLVEAGVTFVTVNFDPHSFSFDMHGNVKGGMESAGPRMDSAIPALVEDLHERGLDKRVLVIAWGEFGRTPRINNNAGRDHWGQVMSVLLACGNLRVGQVIGSSTAKGETPKDRPIKPEDVVATIYRHLAIDPATYFTDRAGRPIPLLHEGQVIDELV